MEPTTALTWLLAIPLVAPPVIYLVGRISYRMKPEDPNASWPSRLLAILTLLASFVPLYFTGQALADNHFQTINIHFNSIAMRIDGISVLMSAIVTLLGLLIAIYSITYIKDEVGQEKHYALLVATVGVVIGLCSSGDLFNMWVWFEAMSLTANMLVIFYRDSGPSLEAAVKYLLQSAAGSALIVIGIAIVFGNTGTLEFSEIAAHITAPSPLLLVAGAFFVIGFGVKAAFAPMHTWLPDAHSQAPSGISALLSGVVIETGMIAMLRVIGPLSGITNAWGYVILAIAALNMFVGNLMALRQKEVKRMLAYSSVSQMGYILLGIGIGITYGQFNGAAGGFFHVFNHAMMKGLAFFGAGAFLFTLHIAKGSHHPLVLEDLNGASKRYPLTAFMFSLGLLALGAMPPLAGFMSEWQIFMAGAQTKNTLALVLVFFTALNSLLSLGYYAPLVNRIYRKAPSEIVQKGKPVTPALVIPMVITTLFVIVLGFYPSLISWLTDAAAAALFAGFGG
jgi:proton-translocating NADH-quinone oxidoreductase chain N